MEWVARQLGVRAADLGFYEWTGRSIVRQRSQIRKHLGFRECSVADANKLAAWLAEHVAEAERNPEVVAQELLGRCREEHIEPPAAGRIERIVSSALRQAEENLCLRIASRVSAQATTKALALIAVSDPEEGRDDESEREAVPLGFIRADPGNVSLESMLTEIKRLVAVRSVGLPPGLFGDVAPKVVAAWRARASVEAPSHMREHAQELRLTLLAAPGQP